MMSQKAIRATTDCTASGAPGFVPGLADLRFEVCELGLKTLA
jgi:hypothetical protein